MAEMNAKGRIWQALGSLLPGQNNSVSTAMDVAIVSCTDRSSAHVNDEYVQELLFLACNSPGSISLLTGKIARRLQTTNDYVVALKTLLLLHRLLRGGDRRFELCVCNLHSTAELRLDLRRFSQANSFLRRYADFLKERMRWWITSSGNLEPVQPSRERNGLALYQVFLDRVVECSPERSFVGFPDRLVQSALVIILKESFRVYASFCDGLMGMEAWEGGGIAEKAALQMVELRDFYEECKRVVRGKQLEFPRVRIFAAGDVIDAAGKGAVAPPRLETRISNRWVVFDD